MKFIGRVEVGRGDQITPEDQDYAGGFIVQLTESEAEILAALQLASEGHSWDLAHLSVRYRHPADKMMDGIFKLIHEWTVVKFAVNDLRRMVNELDDTLMSLEKSK